MELASHGVERRGKPHAGERGRALRLQVRSKTWLEANGQFVMGEFGTPLLEAIDRLGSIQQAAKQLGWSYRHTWDYIRNLEQAAGVPIVLTRRGASPVGGAELSPVGRRLLHDYKRFQERVRQAVERASRSLFFC